MPRAIATVVDPTRTRARRRTNASRRDRRSEDRAVVTLRTVWGSGGDGSVAEAPGHLSRRGAHARSEVALETLEGQSKRRAAEADSADDPARVVSDGCGEAAHAQLQLFVLEGQIRGEDTPELVREPRPTDHRATGQRRGFLRFPELIQLVLGPEGELRLAQRRGVGRLPPPEVRHHPDCLARLGHVNANRVCAVEDAETGGFVRFPGQLLEHGTRLLDQTEVVEEYARHLEGLHTKPIVAALELLLDVTARFQGRQQPEDVVLVGLGSARDPARGAGAP